MLEFISLIYFCVYYLPCINNLFYIYYLFNDFKLYELHLSSNLEYFNIHLNNIEKSILTKIKYIFC